MPAFPQHVLNLLGALDQHNLRRRPLTIEAAAGPHLSIAGRTVLGLCSNDYLGLSRHPALAAATRQALDTFPSLGSTASRHIGGTTPLHLLAEAHLAAFLRYPHALLFSSGYAANVGVLQSLVGPGDVIFSDALNHASLIDGCRLSRARVVVFPHTDTTALAAQLAALRAHHRAAIIVTESLFSMDGDEAPLAALRALADQYDAGLLVDEAHALGVFGPRGSGLCAESGVQPDALVGTLGKAFGASGAFVAGSADLVDLVRNRARSFVFSTAPPPALAAAATTACALVAAADSERALLLRHAAHLRRELSALGYNVLPGRSPILPILIGDPAPTMALSASLLEHGVFVHGIRPPTVPHGSSRLRVTACAALADRDLDSALTAFRRARPQHLV